jgi:hypothetical protein
VQLQELGECFAISRLRATAQPSVSLELGALLRRLRRVSPFQGWRCFTSVRHRGDCSL